MKKLIGILLLSFTISSYAIDSYEYIVWPASLKTYAETEAYCVSDGDEMWIPWEKLLARVIVVGDLQYLDRWFWSSTEVPSELCPENETCHFQVYTKTLESRVGIDSQASGHGLCVSVGN